MPLGELAGIRIQIHWSFFLIIAWVLLSGSYAGLSPAELGSALALLLTVFGCILLHELGHSLAARRYGIDTHDITLYPIGGVARLAQIPREPRQELVIALAGPAVNVAIAAALAAIIAPLEGFGGLLAAPFRSGSFLGQLFVANFMIVAFNMLPAFPLDGGRVFRAALAMFLQYSTATRVAAVVGQGFAALLALLALAGNPMLLFIAAFIFLAAAGETRQAALIDRLRQFQVRDGMLRSFRVVPLRASLNEIGEWLLNPGQRAFPVVDNEQIVGMISRRAILRELQAENPRSVEELVNRDVGNVRDDEGMVQVLDSLTASDGAVLPVTRNGELAGLLDLAVFEELAGARRRLRALTPAPATLPLAVSGSH